MKILIVAGTFPPYCPAASSRANKFAKYLEDQKHDVRVLAPKNTEFKRAILVPEISLNRIHYTEYSNINDFPTYVINKFRSLFGLTKKVREHNAPIVSVPEVTTKVRKESKISILYRQLTNIPDDLVGWYPHGVREGMRMFKDWSPDIIFATSPPHTAMFIARRLGRIIDVPVVYDYRDLWTGHPYYDHYDSTGLRKYVDMVLENYLLRYCAGLVTVTKTWADYLERVRRLPVQCAMNGFDPDDFQGNKGTNYDDQKITLLYAGLLYDEMRDPSILFEALGKIGDGAKNFNLLLYTSKGLADLSNRQKGLIKQYNLEQIVTCSRFIPQKELHKLQQQVDILLLLRWNDPSEDGVIAGKLFEYIGAGKPILSLGSTTGEAADIVRDNDFGLVSNDVDEIVAYLLKKLEQKRRGELEDFVNPNRDKFKRSIQFDKIITFLERIIADKINNNAHR
ncbi:MAG: glycosyltransferase [Emcibacter sp.]|nr:glycosyltransferase [Emcibacter sp.]